MPNNRVNEIDLLRFIAALSVVFFHYSFRGYAAGGMSIMPYPLMASFSKYGYLGVELFFMISGFVILKTAANGGLGAFVFSRFVRLYPAFWVCCTITFATTLVIGGSRFHATLAEYLANMTMMSEFIGVQSIDGAYWSLFVEMRFYLYVAIILVIGRIHQAQLILSLWLIASLAQEFVPSYKLRYILIADFSSYFIAGATFFLIWCRGISIARILIIFLSWGLGLFQTINGLHGFESYYHTDMSRSVVAGIITVFFLVMFIVSLRRTGILGRSNWVVIGGLTYPLYLLHQYIGFMLFNALYPKFNQHVIFWGTLVFMLGTAYVVHNFIEKRFALYLRSAINNFLIVVRQVAVRGH
jgi:peptidoglycan/LPS O-acetylase OafA/YrhL